MDEEVIEMLRAARPVIPDALNDRQADICEPLLAIADLAGGAWPDLARLGLVELCGGGGDDESITVKLLAATRRLFDERDVDRLSTQELLSALIEQEDGAPWPAWWEKDLANGNTRGPAAKLAKLLKPFGIVAGSIRLPDGTTPKGYKRESFADAWERYLPTVEARNATTPQSA